MIHFSYYGGTGRTFCGAEVDEAERTEELDKMTCMKCYEMARKKWIV